MDRPPSQLQGPPAQLRMALVEAAARLIAAEGPAGLTLRRVADAVGTSTMAIYTHFGGMPELRRAVRREGFARLAQRLDAVRIDDDPVAELSLRGAAYFQNAVENPDLYRVMFMEQPLNAVDGLVIWDTFDSMVDNVRRCVEAGRFVAVEPRAMAVELWTLAHGVVTLLLAQLLSLEEALGSFDRAGRHLFAAYSIDRETTLRSMDRARLIAMRSMQAGS